MAKKLNYLGVDLGGSSIKVVELKNMNNRPQLATYGFVDEMHNIVKDDTRQARKQIASSLKELLKQSRVTSENAVAALPSFSVFSSIISLPAMNKKDLLSAVRWEAKKFVPIPLEEMILDWEVLGMTEEKAKANKTAAPSEKEKKAEAEKKEGVKEGVAKGNIKVLLTAAPKTLVNKYVELFKEVGLRLVGLETESFALERSLVGNDHNPIMVVDVGSQATSIIIFSEGVPILNRSIDVGGKTITKSLVEVMGLEEEQAEQFKRDMMMPIGSEPGGSVPRPVKYVLSSIINEIRYIFNLYRAQNKQPITKVILSGGGSFLTDLTAQIEHNFNIKAYIGDPWARVLRPVELEAMLKQLGPRLAVAIGLAMREFNP